MWGKPDVFLPGRRCISCVPAASGFLERWGYALSPETLCAARQVLSLPLFRPMQKQTERDRVAEPGFVLYFVLGDVGSYRRAYRS